MLQYKRRCNTLLAVRRVRQHAQCTHHTGSFLYSFAFGSPDNDRTYGCSKRRGNELIRRTEEPII